MPTNAAKVQAASRAWIETTDDAVRDIPVFQYAIELQDKIFAIADEVGVGDEARAIVYAIRSLEYASVVAPGLAPAAVAGAGAGVLTSVGAVSLLGAVAVVAVALSWLFGGGDDDLQHENTKRAQAHTLRLRDRLSLQAFAEEQDGVAGGYHVMASLPFPSLSKGAAAKEAHARKLAAFYRAAIARLSPADRAAMESMSNLSRWQGALLEYQKLSQSKKDALDVMFGTSAPRLPWQLKGPVATETAALAAMLGDPVAPKAPMGPQWIGKGLQQTIAKQKRPRVQAAKALAGVGALALVTGGVYYVQKRGLPWQT